MHILSLVHGDKVSIFLAQFCDIIKCLYTVKKYDTQQPCNHVCLHNKLVWAGHPVDVVAHSNGFYLIKCLPQCGLSFVQ